MQKIKMIGLDLDGTLLNDKKETSLIFNEIINNKNIKNENSKLFWLFQRDTFGLNIKLDIW